MGELYVQYEYWVAAIQLILAMLGMGATLTGKDFHDVVREPKAVTIGCLVQLLAVPFVAFLFIKSLGLVGGIAVGIALIAAIPGGTTSNIFTYMARGNSPLSISITALTTLACLISTPLILGLLITDYLPADFAMPAGQIVLEIAVNLLLPLMVGMAVLKFLPAIAPSLSKWSIRLSLFAIFLIVIGSASAGRLDIEAFGTNNLFLVLLFLLLIAVMSWFLPKFLGLTIPDRTAIEMEAMVRNVNLAVLIKASMFPAIFGISDPLGDTVLFTVLLYGGMQMIVAAILIVMRRRT